MQVLARVVLSVPTNQETGQLSSSRMISFIYEKIFFFQMVPPRGCAYCVLVNRLDASKVLVTLKNARIQGNSLKVGTWHHLLKLRNCV